MTGAGKPLERYTLPELAQGLVDDPRRQDFANLWNDDAEGLVNDKVQLIRAWIDRGEDLDGVDEQGRTALEILVDPRNRISTDPQTVLALLQAGAKTCDGVMAYVVDRLYAQDTRRAALVFHERAQSGKPLAPLEAGNYYHAMIDTEPHALVMIVPIVDMVRRHDIDQELDPAERALFSDWLGEARAKDGNTPALLAWEAFAAMEFSEEEEKARHRDYMWAELWELTARYLHRGGDLQQVNHAGRSIAFHLLELDARLGHTLGGEGSMWAINEETRSSVMASMLDACVPGGVSKAPRPRM